MKRSGLIRLIVILLAAPLIVAAGPGAPAPRFESPAVNQVLSQMDAIQKRARIILARAINDARQNGNTDEVKKLQDALASIPGGDEATAADSLGRVSWRGSRYQLVNVAVSWHQAKALCEAMGGHLVYIKSAPEQAIVQHLAEQSSAWIGATDAGTEDQWRWGDGSNVGQAPWTPGNPSNDRGQEHFAHITENGQWNDASDGAGFVNAFICEWD